MLTDIKLTDFIGGNADIQSLRTIAWCCAVEGEAADGREFQLTEIEFGRLMTMENVVAFSLILVSQSGNSGQKKSPEPKGRKPFFHFRKQS
jgi:hypothetical protein